MAFGVSTGAPGSPCAFIQRSNSFRSLAKRLADLFSRVGTGEAVLFTQVTHRRGVLDELVRPADAHHRRGDAAVTQMIAHDAAVAALDHVILDGDDHVIERAAAPTSGGSTE